MYLVDEFMDSTGGRKLSWILPRVTCHNELFNKWDKCSCHAVMLKRWSRHESSPFKLEVTSRKRRHICLANRSTIWRSDSICAGLQRCG